MKESKRKRRERKRKLDTATAARIAALMAYAENLFPRAKSIRTLLVAVTKDARTINKLKAHGEIVTKTRVLDDNVRIVDIKGTVVDDPKPEISSDTIREAHEAATDGP